MTIPEAVHLCAGFTMSTGESYILDMGQPVPSLTWRKI